MSNAIQELLECVTEVGAIIRPSGDHLILRAGARPVPVELVKRVRQAKPELLAALCPGSISKSADQSQAANAANVCWWRSRYMGLAFAWSRGGDRDWDAARRLAWGDLQNEWHCLYGQRWPTWQCAGCDAPIGGLEALSLPDGNRVHLNPIDCVIRFGRRWRGAADEALVVLGLEPPDIGKQP